MSRRTELAKREPEEIPAPPSAARIDDPRVPAGCCPKCGIHVGRAVRAHAKHCHPALRAA